MALNEDLPDIRSLMWYQKLSRPTYCLTLNISFHGVRQACVTEEISNCSDLPQCGQGFSLTHQSAHTVGQSFCLVGG